MGYSWALVETKCLPTEYQMIMQSELPIINWVLVDLVIRSRAIPYKTDESHAKMT